jgi:23S rRNA (adenine2503-C2)-methyltransferase
VAKTLLKGHTLPELQALFAEMGQPKYRAEQVFNWLYNHKIFSFAEMENLPKSLRTELDEKFSLLALEKVNEEKSGSSGTAKIIYKTGHGHIIESVIIPDEGRATLCVSTQVGCPLDCTFCATGLMGFKMNLTPGEIFDQYALAQASYPNPITNLVYMGMGEPLINYDSTVRSLEIFSEELTKGISLKKITVSTSGIPHKIKELANTNLKVKLALSLHSCFEDIRSQIMPVNKKYSLKSNLEAVKYYAAKTDTRITFEYIMLKGVNDRLEDVKALIKLCRSVPSKVNIIPFNSLKHMNPTGFSGTLVPTSRPDIEIFASKLRVANITVMLRDTKGDDIAAACGQLAIKEQKFK